MRAISAALRSITSGSAPSTVRRRRQAPATTRSTASGLDSNTTLPLWMKVRVFSPPARANASRSTALSTWRPPTFTARSSAT
jgi:hypothetical protein